MTSAGANRREINLAPARLKLDARAEIVILKSGVD